MATKNTTKLDPKVATGETFTSLQISSSKNADQESMEQKLRLLYKLQKTDSKIDQIYLMRGELPLEVQDLEDEILGHKTKIAALQKEVKDIDTLIAKHKQNIVDCKAAVKKYEQQRNNVKNNREFDSLSKEIEYQNLDSELSEKKAADASKSLVLKKEELAEQSAELKGREQDLADKKQELETIVKETEKDEKALLKQSEEIQAQMDQRMLNAYEKVRANSRNKMAVVTVVRGACGGCFNKIPPQREIDIESSKRIIVCEYCGRILVSSKFEDEEKEAEGKGVKKPAETKKTVEEKPAEAQKNAAVKKPEAKKATVKKPAAKKTK